MDGLTVYTRNGLMNSLFQKTSVFGALASPPTFYVALYQNGGSTEVSAAGYARKQTAPADWNAAAQGLIDNAAEITMDEITEAAGEVTDVKLFDAASGGNELGSGALVNAKSAFVADAGNDTLTIPNHSFQNDDRVRVFGSNLPTGLSEGTDYYVVNAAADTLQLSATQGGAAIDLTADGHGYIAKTAYKTIDAGTTPKFAAGELDIEIR